ncbi:hypothetical protein BDF22DRAFT_745783 [Syncephalis plumigaleata]|nr:hypothetical protein BDF22DRAFT_745783 [Syncephalis plumigaleata]
MIRHTTYTESIIYLVLACVLAAIYIVTTMGYYYFAPDTPELRKRSVSLTIVGAIASAGISTVFMVQAASPKTNPSFLPLWGAYIGFAAWSVSLLGRVWRARFLADIRRTNNNHQHQQQYANSNEMHAQLRREQNWLRRRRAPMGDITLTGIMAAIGASTLICLILVQCMSTRYRLVPLDLGSHNWGNWEYIPFYVMSGFFMVILCPVILWLLLGMHDAYNIASDLQLTVSFTLMIAPIYFIWTSIPALERTVDAILWLVVLLFAAHVFSVIRPLKRALRLRLERRLLSRNQFYRALDDPVAFRRLERLAEADFSVENCRFIEGYRKLQERTKTVKRQQEKKEEERRLKAEQAAAENWNTLQAAQVAMQTALAMRALGLPGTVEFSPTSPQHYHMADTASHAEEKNSSKVALDWNPPRISCIEIPSAVPLKTTKSAPQPIKIPLNTAPSGMRARPMSSHSMASSCYSNSTRKSEMIEVAQHVTLKTYHSNASVLPSPVTPRSFLTKRTSSLASFHDFNSQSARATRLADAQPMPALPPSVYGMSSSAHNSFAPSSSVSRNNRHASTTIGAPSTRTSTIPPVPTISVSLIAPPEIAHANRITHSSYVMNDHTVDAPTITSLPTVASSGLNGSAACSVFTENSEQMADFVNNGSLPDWLAGDYRRFYYVYLAEGALLEVNVDHGVRSRVRNAITLGQIEPTIFDEAYHAVLDLLYRNTFPRYVSSLLNTGEMEDLDDDLDDTDEIPLSDHPEAQLVGGPSYDVTSDNRKGYLSRLTGSNGYGSDQRQRMMTMTSTMTTSKNAYGRGRGRKRANTLTVRLRRWWRRQRDELTAWRDDRNSQIHYIG